MLSLAPRAGLSSLRFRVCIFLGFRIAPRPSSSRFPFPRSRSTRGPVRLFTVRSVASNTPAPAPLRTTKSDLASLVSPSPPLVLARGAGPLFFLYASSAARFPSLKYTRFAFQSARPPVRPSARPLVRSSAVRSRPPFFQHTFPPDLGARSDISSLSVSLQVWSSRPLVTPASLTDPPFPYPSLRGGPSPDRISTPR